MLPQSQKMAALKVGQSRTKYFFGLAGFINEADFAT
jgi:hypothetical protein